MTTGRQMKTLLHFRLVSMRNGLQQLREHSRFKVATILGISVFLWTGLFRLAWIAFSWIQNQNEFVGDMITEFIFDIFFFSLGGMLLVSNILMGFGSLFSSTEARFLCGTPINRRAVFLFKGMESLGFSSWAVLALGLPLFLAFGLTHQPSVSGWYYLNTFLAVFMFLFMIGGLGQMFNMLIAAYFPKNRKVILVTVLTLLVAAIAAWVVYRLNLYHAAPPSTRRALEQLPEQFSFLRHPLLPTHWVTNAVLMAAQGKTLSSFFFLGLMASTACLSIYAFLVSGIFLYERACDRVRSSTGGRASHAGAIQRLFSRMFGKKYGMLLSKDLLYFLRDPSQWLQFVILFGLLLFYFLNLRTIGYHAKTDFWKSLIASLNLFSVTMVLATLSTRFFFPLISLEGSRFWVLGLAPVSRQQLLRAKFLFALFCNVVLAEGMILISNIMLDMNLSFSIYQLGVTLCASLALASLAVGLGAIFPDFNAQTPAKAVSGFGGTLCMIVSLGYVMVLVIVASIPPIALAHYHRHPLQRYHLISAALAIGLILVGSALAVLWPLRTGGKALEEAEL